MGVGFSLRQVFSLNDLPPSVANQIFQYGDRHDFTYSFRPDRMRRISL